MSRRRTNKSALASQDVNPEIDDAVQECVRYILCREGSKLPIKRVDLLKHLSGICQTSSGEINVIVAESNKVLKRVYGYKLVQIDSKGGVQYIVVLADESPSNLSSAIDPTHRRILVAALIHIYMTGGPVKDEDMWKFLDEAGLLQDTDHSGRKLLTHTFTKQLYLSYTKMGEGDTARNVFEWGQRAVEEIPKMFMLKKMAECNGDFSYRRVSPYLGLLVQSPRRMDFLRCVDKMIDSISTIRLRYYSTSFICGGRSTTVTDAPIPLQFIDGASVCTYELHIF
ncbi:Non-structural maintenance of chromosomes element 3 homolog [Eumeta japonica]|uniref:Non-structural maintenance of chromosomes element 3 homolog n=1 Tax=Eumeta variegata TaxID=151549 RepID=A0A4C1X1Y7_EUMVA|nr:Non-structural maintenance of chromosomes element 3 homolog [Eumeta japonica]